MYKMSIWKTLSESEKKTKKPKTSQIWLLMTDVAGDKMNLKGTEPFKNGLRSRQVRK